VCCVDSARRILDRGIGDFRQNITGGRIVDRNPRTLFPCAADIEAVGMERGIGIAGVSTAE